MPTWLLTALIIILVLWTILDFWGWYGLAVYKQRYPFIPIKINRSAAPVTLFIICCWIFLICYWLR